MKIIAIDPGYRQSALVAWTGEEITRKEILENEKARDVLGTDFVQKTVVIEMISSYGMPVGREVFETVLWIGRFVERATAYGHDVHLVYRHAIKMHLCNSARAKDSNIRRAIIDRFGGDAAIKKGGPLHGVSKDLWSALAVALYFDDTRKREVAA